MEVAENMPFSMNIIDPHDVEQVIVYRQKIFIHWPSNIGS
jgi:hypothetical protein